MIVLLWKYQSMIGLRAVYNPQNTRTPLHPDTVTPGHPDIPFSWGCATQFGFQTVVVVWREHKRCACQEPSEAFWSLCSWQTGSSDSCPGGTRKVHVLRTSFGLRLMQRTKCCIMSLEPFRLLWSTVDSLVSLSSVLLVTDWFGACSSARCQCHVTVDVRWD